MTTSATEQMYLEATPYLEAWTQGASWEVLLDMYFNSQPAFGTPAELKDAQSFHDVAKKELVRRGCQFWDEGGGESIVGFEGEAK